MTDLPSLLPLKPNLDGRGRGSLKWGAGSFKEQIINFPADFNLGPLDSAWAIISYMSKMMDVQRKKMLTRIH